MLMVIADLGMMLQMASRRTVLQTIVDDDKRSRVTSFYLMAFMGITPLIISLSYITSPGGFEPPLPA